MEKLFAESSYNQINKTPVKYVPFILLASFTINILSLALPLTIKQIYNRIIVYDSLDMLLILITGCVVALILESLLRYIKDSTSKWISAKYDYRLTMFLSNKFLHADQSETADTSHSENLDKFNSTSRMASFFSDNYYQTLVDLPFMFLFLYLIYYIGGYLVLVPIVLASLYVVVMLIFAGRYVQSKSAYVENNNKVMSRLTEALENIHLIKAAGIEESQIKKFKKTFDSTLNNSFKVNMLKMIPDNITSYFSQLVLFSVICAGGYFMITGELYFGEITASALLSGRAVNPIQRLMNSHLQLNDVKLHKSKLDEVASYPERYSEDTPFFPEDIDGAVELMDICYQNVQGELSQPLSCLINPGDFVYIDPTAFLSYREVLNKITGMEKIEHGRILIDSLDISQWNMDNLKGKIEYLTDRVSIFKGSVMDNITFFEVERTRDAYEAASLTGFDQMVARMPEGFETQLDSNAVNYLSSTFLQRLNLTRALLQRPRIFIADRVDESMDYETLTNFIWLLQKLKGKVTIIVATDNHKIMELADKVLHAGGIDDA